MANAARSLGVVVVLAALGGCHPATTRLPTLAPAPNAVERRSLGHFDPLPDRNLGPDTNSRPAEFLQGREPQRQSLEGQYLRGAPAGPVPPGYPTGAYRDNEVVR